MLEAIIFDMDGLLIDSEPFWRKAEIEAFAEVGVELTESDCRETMGYRLNEVVALWHSRKPWQGKAPEAVEQRIISLVRKYIGQEGKPMKMALETIRKCREAGLKTAIASSSPLVLIEEVVNAFVIADQFDLLHSAQFEEYGKPHPAIFITTARKLGVAPDRCLVLEDSFHGVVAALAAKMKVVAVPDATMRHDPRFKAATRTLESLEGFSLDGY